MGSITQSDMTTALTEAIQTISKSNANAISSTLVVEAEIVDVIDAGLGTYKIKYLGNVFEANAAHTEIAYEINDLVNVIIPNGDFNKNKIILSPINASDVVYGSTTDDTVYIPLGDNLFKYINDISLSTYRPHEPRVFEDIDTEGFSILFKSALSDSRVFNFTCKIQTKIDPSRRSNGNYGLYLDIPILQEIDGILTQKYYSVKLDITNMTGDPYAFVVPARQNLYFTLPDDMDYDNTKEPRIRTFVNDFLGEDANGPDDIFITDLQVLSVLSISEESMSGYYAVITSSGGNTFLSSRTSDVKILSANVFLNGKNTNISKFDCYWFKENVSINTSSDKYYKVGGIGWEILNTASKVETAEDGSVTHQYISNVYKQTVKQEEIHCDTKFKCVLVKIGSPDIVVTAEVIIKNNSNNANINLHTSTLSNKYTENIGDVQLICEYEEEGITNIANPNFIINYAWQRLDKDGSYIDNDFYTVDEYNVRQNNKYITKVHYPVSEIDKVNTIGCTVYIETPDSNSNSIKRQIIGTKWITISTEEPQAARLMLSNADKVYKYDADGDSPMVAEYDGPLTSAITNVDPIEVRIFKINGQELSPSEYDVVTMTWLVPINSLITLNNNLKSDTTSNPGYYTITGNYNTYKRLMYGIANSYNKNKSDNTIIIKAKAPNALFDNTEPTAVTNLQFLKDGEGGTNGSKYSAIVTYNGYGYSQRFTNNKPYKFQLIYAADTARWLMYNPAFPNVLTPFSNTTFSVNLYVNGERTGSVPAVTWKIFDSNNSNDNIVSPVNINSSGTITLNGNKWTNTNQNFCVTLEAKVKTATDVSVTYSEEYIYAYYPIECAYAVKESYLSTLCPTFSGGFSKVIYASDGTNPQYDNSQSFYIEDNFYEGDITELYDYTWAASGNIKVKNVTGGICNATPITKYDNGYAKNYIKSTITRSNNKLSILQNKLEIARNNLTLKNNLLSYYTTMQNNLDIFGNFDYNRYIEELTTASVFYSAKNNIINATNNMLECGSRIINICNNYLDNNGSIDSKVRDIIVGVSDKITILNELANLNYKLGTETGIITKIKAITPSIVVFNNKIDFVGTPSRNCYFSINDAIDSYNNSVLNYTTSYNLLVNDTEIINCDTIAISVINELRDFINNPKFTNLSLTYYGVNEQAYRYSALHSTLKTYIDSASTLEGNSYNYTLLIENIIKPMYQNLLWYINFYYGGGYSPVIAELNTEILNLQNEITKITNMISSGVSTYIIHIKPIIMLYNRYEMSNINGWDGNKLDISSSEGYILAPQMGAGRKNSDNSFTGIVMGVKKTGTRQNIGLFGFNSGVQSIFLNAEDGSATFGSNGKGQVIIQPGENRAIIKSGNYSSNSGLLIDLTTPEIRFGSGNFVVNSAGHLTAKGGGTVGGWNIGDHSLTAGYITLHADGWISGGSSYSWSIGYDGTGRFSNVHITGGSLNISNQAIIDSSGTATLKKLYASVSGEIGGWVIGSANLKSKTGNISLNGNGSIVGPTWNISSAGIATFTNVIITGNGASQLTSNTSSLNWGENFSVDGSGVLRCKRAIIEGKVTAGSGSIGGWNITSSGLQKGSFHIYSSGSIGCDDIWASGGIYAESGQKVATQSWCRDHFEPKQ